MMDINELYNIVYGPYQKPAATEVTGNIFVRDTGEETGDGRKLVIVIGILAVADPGMDGESLYVAEGKEDGLTVSVNIHKLSREDVSRLSTGESPSGLLRQPIWRY